MTKTLTEQQIRKIIENVTGKAAKVCEQKFYGKPKSLTEQWRNGTLPRGAYYVNRLNEIRVYLVTYEDNKNTHEIYEVLAPVPSYDEWKTAKENLEKNGTWYTERSYKRIEKKLAIAKKALKEYADSSNWYETDDFGISAVDQFSCDDYGYNIARKALKEMEGVK